MRTLARVVRPRWIGVAVAGFLNARFVGRLGMRVISHGALVGFVAVAGIMLLAVKMHMLPLPLFIVLAALMMFAFGLMFANDDRYPFFDDACLFPRDSR